MGAKNDDARTNDLLALLLFYAVSAPQIKDFLKTSFEIFILPSSFDTLIAGHIFRFSLTFVKKMLTSY